MEIAEHPDKYRARMDKAGHKNGNKFNSLSSQVMYSQMLPTPLASDAQGKENAPSQKSRADLSAFAANKMLPTPQAVQRDHPERVEKLKATGAQTMSSRKAGELRPNSILDAMSFYDMLPAPTAAEGFKVTKESAQESLHKTFQAGGTSQLNPRFVGEMMGFPPDWLELPFLDTGANQSKHTEMP